MREDPGETGTETETDMVGEVMGEVAAVSTVSSLSQALFSLQVEVMVLYNNSYLQRTDRGHMHPITNTSSLLKSAASKASKEGFLRPRCNAGGP